MPLLSLHTVELQSALQFLPLVDLLSFNRCSSATLALTFSPFVCRHVTPFAISSSTLEDAVRRSSSPLIRFVPLRIVWQPAAPGVSVRARLESIIQARLIVAEFDASTGGPLNMELWDLILSCPWSRGLRTLKLHETDPSTGRRWFRRTFDLIAAMPQLVSLHMIVKDPSRDLTPWFALDASTSLTHATIDDHSHGWIGGQPFNLHAPNLTSLHLNSPLLMGQNFDVFFAHESMLQLRRLHLQRLRVESVLNGQAQAIAGLKYLVNLEEMTLTDVLCSAWLLDEFHLLRSLRLVTIQLHGTSHHVTSFIPNEHFVQMLRCSPQLHCVLIPSMSQIKTTFFLTRWDSLARAACWKEFGQRMRIQPLPVVLLSSRV